MRKRCWENGAAGNGSDPCLLDEISPSVSTNQKESKGEHNHAKTLEQKTKNKKTKNKKKNQAGRRADTQEEVREITWEVDVSNQPETNTHTGRAGTADKAV